MNNIYEAVKNPKGKEHEIIDAGRNDLPEFFKMMGYKVGVEIGVCKGEYSEILAKAGLKIYSVDPYTTYPGYSGAGIQERLDAELAEATERLAPYDATIVRKTSMEAVKGFEDESLDFVYIDGHHEFKYVVEDIAEWSKKVRKGGCIAGHDFVFSPVHRGPYVCHVKYVVRAYTAAHRIANWWVIGRKHFPADSKEKRDTWRSWFWLKS